MRVLNALSAVYLLGASAFGVAIALQRNPELKRVAERAGQAAWPVVTQAAAYANERAIRPALARAVEADKAFFDAIDPPRIAKGAPRWARASVATDARTRAAAPIVAPSRTWPARPAAVVRHRPAMTLAPPAPAPGPSMTPAAGEVERVMERLKDNLTAEMLQNFGLFLYVSKADEGPWAQRMYVFRKRPSGDLDLLYNWPVSTGREADEIEPSGRLTSTHTPRGYYELDPNRFYVRHVSGEWRHPMPHAMFFTWIDHGRLTGLAIHGATKDDEPLLGTRASAGCVRLAPENAAVLFDLIRKDYKGLAPRFAYDRRTASMSNDGLLMHDATGHVKFADGYRVLVFIENYGGQNVVAAVF
ncbi:MAG TPA: L,D-transpeptidase [Rhizomicrobium sp.]|jgi:lipoprotein-anchoring transpeptidase ErfK/SrfK|nr:L,D-transpeptidase [Rhizomicrobium sp.]